MLLSIARSVLRNRSKQIFNLRSELGIYNRGQNKLVPTQVRMASIDERLSRTPLKEMKIVGWYKDQIGSRMHIAHAEDGLLKGYFWSKVEPDRGYPLSGHYDTDGQVLGWAVSYQCKNKNSAWSGQVYKKLGQNWIHTTYVLTSTTCRDDLWYSTNVGIAIFQPDNGDNSSVD